MAPASAFAELGEAAEAQMADAHAIAAQDAADAATAYDQRTRGHRMSAEQKLAHQVGRLEMGTFSAEPSFEDLDQMAISAAHEDMSEVTPDDIAAVLTEAPGAMTGIASQFYAEHEGAGTRGYRQYGDPDADDRDAAVEDLMPDVGGYSGYLKSQGW